MRPWSTLLWLPARHSLERASSSHHASSFTCVGPHGTCPSGRRLRRPSGPAPFASRDALRTLSAPPCLIPHPCSSPVRHGRAPAVGALLPESVCSSRVPHLCRSGHACAQVRRSARSSASAGSRSIALPSSCSHDVLPPCPPASPHAPRQAPAPASPTAPLAPLTSVPLPSGSRRAGPRPCRLR